MNEQLQVGRLVVAAYKTGQYVGEVAEPPTATKVAVKILAVVTHPTQGDLHNPMEANVAFFHQRRALAYQEIALIPLQAIRPYQGEVADYKESLRQALTEQIDELKSDSTPWASRCLQELEALRQDYQL